VGRTFGFGPVRPLLIQGSDTFEVIVYNDCSLVTNN
jgi:hypothetical protein